MDRNIATLPIRCFDSGKAAEAQDLVAVEEPLQISVDGRDLTVTMRTPGQDKELALGFLFSEGLLQRPEQVESIERHERGGIDIRLASGVAIEPERFARNFYMTSSCGVCGKASIDALRLACSPDLARDYPRVSAPTISALPERLRMAQSVFDRTGGLHAAGLFDAHSGELLMSREDVGRHNAVDKLIGAAFFGKLLPLDRHILFLSGRVSFELVQKALMAGIAVVGAVGAPSSLAVDTARRFGLTLAGFVRGKRFNVYSGAARVEGAVGTES
ncbi:MAG: FdhD protein [Bryobacterales bacterium]|jgi:FdhD protein|nr:FdhD protein [Bryobacterales bacterium]